jgi:ribonuclease Y
MKREAELEARDKAIQYKQQVDEDNKERMHEIRSAESRVAQREESLDRRSDSLDNRENQISAMQEQLEIKQDELIEAENEVEARLEKVAGMTPQQAKEELLETIRDEVNHDSAAIIRESEARTKAEADKKARMILSLAIQRVAADHTAESTVTSIHIPSDDLKGRIIGREGRNIRSFEQLTGTNLIIDDTPECVTVSCFDPVRREIGRVTMESLISDGRIHPARIEEMYEKAVALVNQRIREAGEQAAFDTGIHDLHPELVLTLGKLLYRTSYGQNVLNHSLEVSYLSGVMASELGLDPISAKRAGLLHDLGKAVDHEIDGSHAVLGADLARRYGERPEIVHAIEAHHEDVEPNTVLDVLIQAADAISASRPGARKETLDAYIKRLEKLEEIANSYNGVERTYAIQAGREVRVMVKPEVVDEAESVVLAHNIARQIEAETQYPGQVKVVVIRESRAIDFAK